MDTTTTTSSPISSRDRRRATSEAPRRRGRLRKQRPVWDTQSASGSRRQAGSLHASDADLDSLLTLADEPPPLSVNADDDDEDLTERLQSHSSPLLRDDHSAASGSRSERMAEQRGGFRSKLMNFIPRFGRRNENGVSQTDLPVFKYDDVGEKASRSNSAAENGRNGVPRNRWSPGSRSRTAEPVGRYFSDGQRLIDYVLAYDLDQKEEDAVSVQSDADSDAEAPANTHARLQSAFEKRKIFEANLQTMGLELEYITAKHSRTAFVLVHAPFKVLMKQAELLKIKMPIQQNDVKKHANLMDGAVNAFLKRFRFLDFNDVVKSRIEPCDYFCQPFIEQHLECFVNHEDPEIFFSRSERSRMVYDILIRTRYDSNTDGDKLRFGIERLVTNRAYCACYPLHDELDTEKDYDPNTCSDRKLLYENWVKPRNVWKYQPLHSIKNYFGTKIGFYFAWLGYYTRFLYVISMIGIICFLYGVFTLPYDTPSSQICNETGTVGQMMVCPICDSYCDYTRLSESCVYAQITYIFDNYATVLFAAIMSIWATLFLEGWKRYHAELAYKWNVFDFEAEDEVLRPEFQFRRKHLRVNPVTKHDEPYVPLIEKGARFACSGVSVLFFICLIIALVVGVMVYRLIVISLLYKHYYDHGEEDFKMQAVVITSTTAACINLAFILLMNQLYSRLALRLTEMECPRTQTEFDNSYTFKVFLFQFVNFYSSLFYIAFIKGRFSGVPEDGQTIFGHRLEQCDPAGCMVELVIQLFIIMCGKQFINAFMETGYPIVLNWFRRWQLKLPETKKQKMDRLRQESQDIIESAPEGVSLVERDYTLNPVSEQFLFDEYLEMVIQFGFCTLFVCAFPLAPFFALVNNVLEIRLDAYKYIVTQRKPMPLPARNIGIWMTILDLLSKLSVLCNAFVIAFTSDFVPRVLHFLIHNNMDNYMEESMSFYDAGALDVKNTAYENVTVCRFRDYRRHPCSLGLTEKEGDVCDDLYSYSNRWWILLAFRLIFVLVFEHVVLSIKAVFAYLIPDVPTKIVIQLQRERYLARQAVLQRADEWSSSSSAPTTHRASSGGGGGGGEITDTEAVAYQTGQEALEGQELEPSRELKRMYSNRRRPPLSAASSTSNLQGDAPPPAPIPASPNLRVRDAIGRLRASSDSTDSFRTAKDTASPQPLRRDPVI